MSSKEIFDGLFYEQGKIEQALLNAAQVLEVAGVKTADTMHLNCMRSKGDGSVRKIVVTAEQVHRYLERIAEIAQACGEVNWSRGDYQPPVVFADLRYLKIDGNIIAKVAFPVYLDYSEIVHQFRVDIQEPCKRFDASHTQCSNLDIRVVSEKGYGPEKLDINLSKSNFGSLDIASEARFKGVYLNISKAEIGCLVARNLILKNIRADAASFEEVMSFDGCRISIARFAQCKFFDGWMFSNCTFHNAPNFTDAKMDRQHTSFSNCRFRAAGSLIGSRCTPEDVAKYRYLRAHFSRAKDFYYENLFYSLEQRGHRISGNAPFFDKIISFVYDSLSDYGNSVARPFSIFFCQILLFAILFGVIGGAVGRGVFLMHPAIGLSLQNSFNPVGLFSEKSIVTVDSGVTYAFSLVQAIFSVVLIALMLIGIRSRFKKGGGGESS